MKLDGFGIFVKDMAVMIRYYKDVLGFEIREDEDTTNVYLGEGAVSILEPTTEPWEQRTCYVADPEGNLIEIGSFTR